jgi:diguanylate cyclase (GGDEF)-like protein
MSALGEIHESVESSSRGIHGLGRSIRRGFFRLIDSSIPHEILNGDPEELRRARTILGFTVILIALALQSATYFRYALPQSASVRIDAFTSLGMLLTLGIPLCMRRGLPMEFAANLVIGASFVVIATSLTVFGGIESPVIHWLALPPMLAVLMGARRSAWYWAGIGSLTVGTLFALEAFDLAPAAQVDFLQISGPGLWIQRCVDAGSWLLILLTVAFLYERHKDEQTQRLEDKNSELVHEIRQRQMAEDRTHYLAYYDELTTLPNRQLFKEQLARSMENAARGEGMVALLFLDLDGFKEVNDAYGHDLGDQLLRHVAQKLLTCVRAADAVSRGLDGELVSRLGGDEFTILLDGLNDFTEAALVARRVLDSLARPIEVADREIFISASVGIALYPGGAENMDELLRNADLAMYHAKESGRNNFQFFEEEMNSAVVHRNTLAHDLRGALERDELSLEYQPILDQDARRIVGVEALLRWHHPELGLVGPDDFIPIAEETGLIVPIGEWVLRTACRQFSSWRARGIAPARVAVNVSAVQLRSQKLPDCVFAALEDARMDPAHLEVEVTENAMMADEEEASRCLHQLKERGVCIALDDFGTGYSSLSYVKRFPVDALKIDRSFVGVIEDDPEAQAIATAIIAMAHRLGLRVVGEGVETDAQQKFLREHECDELQGYLFAKPLTPDAMSTRLTKQS